MRTFLIGLLGGALVFAFFWYRGDVGVIDLGGDVQLAPPAEKPLIDKLKALQEDARAVRGEFLPSEVAEPVAEAQKFYAGQLIAKPRRERQPSAGRAGVERAFAASSTGAADAVTVASQVGDVQSSMGETMLINLNFDLMEEAEAADGFDAPIEEDGLVAPQAAPGDGVVIKSLSARNFSAARADPRFRRAKAVSNDVRKEAMSRKARLLEDRIDRCPSGVTEEDIAARPALGVACAIDRLKNSGNFEYVEPNLLVTHEMMMGDRPKTTSRVPNDALYALQWHYRGQGAGANQSPGGAGFADYWSKANQVGSADIVVAVVDTGLDLDHPDIKASKNIAQGIDMVSVPFYGNDPEPGRDLDPSDPGDKCDDTDPTAEDSFHGTHVAGTIGAVATNNGAGVAGGAWNVTIVPVRALGRCGGLQSDINDAIRWAAGVEPAVVETPSGARLVVNENPADIINLSLGFRAPSGCPASTQEAINQAVEAGAIVVAAAGNAGINVDGYGPSGCENVVTVSAGDAEGKLAFYSNYGDKVDVMAPGGDMRADLNKDGRPDGVLSTKRSKDCRDPVDNAPVSACSYAYENGTSMAAPHVSAAFALLKAQFRTRSNEELEAMIVGQARTPRSQAQCVGPCASTPGGAPVAGMPNQCFRPCGQGLLDLGKVASNP